MLHDLSALNNNYIIIIICNLKSKKYKLFSWKKLATLAIVVVLTTPLTAKNKITFVSSTFNLNLSEQLYLEYSKQIVCQRLFV